MPFHWDTIGGFVAVLGFLWRILFRITEHLNEFKHVRATQLSHAETLQKHDTRLDGHDRRLDVHEVRLNRVDSLPLAMPAEPAPGVSPA